MAESTLFMEGLNLMLLGMGSVFIFLTMLIVFMKGMSRLARAISPEELQAVASPVGKPIFADEELIAVISAAVTRYRSAKK